MGEASVPVDLLNPGQVFACLGLMELAELLCGPCIGRYDYTGSETVARFVLRVDGVDDPLRVAIRFLAQAEAVALAPPGSTLSATKWKVPTQSGAGRDFPCPEPDSPATLPGFLTDGKRRVPLAYWADGLASGRDNAKFWAGSGGYPGVALARDALALVRAAGAEALAQAVENPYALAAPQSSSFRFDWRRDYIPLDAGFSPNDHSDIEMVGHPLVESLAAIGLQNARPARPDARDKLRYVYGVSSAALPTALARPVLGGASMGFPLRRFRMRLGWPSKEGQARCIIDAEEETSA